VTIRPRPALALAARSWIEVEPERSTEGAPFAPSRAMPLGSCSISRLKGAASQRSPVFAEGQDSLEIVPVLWDGRTDTTRVVIALASPTLRSELGCGRR
jgi:hypothetical protein